MKAEPKENHQSCGFTKDKSSCCSRSNPIKKRFYSFLFRIFFLCENHSLYIFYSLLVNARLCNNRKAGNNPRAGSDSWPGRGPADFLQHKRWCLDSPRPKTFSSQTKPANILLPATATWISGAIKGPVFCRIHLTNCF